MVCACTTNNQYAVFIFREYFFHVQNYWYIQQNIHAICLLQPVVSTTSTNLYNTISVIIKAALRIVGLVTVLV